MASKFEYEETVFVTGDLLAYVRDLARYFRTSLSDITVPLESGKRERARLVDKIESYEKAGRGEPSYNMTRKKEALASLEARLDHLNTFFKAQRVNHGECVRILKAERPLSTLDLTNHAHHGYVVHITYDEGDGSGGEPGRIRMRVFAEGARDPHLSSRERKADAFALHTRHLDGVDAFVTREANVQETLATLEDVLLNGHVRRSKLRVTTPPYTFERQGESVQYSIQLGVGEQELLGLFHKRRDNIVSNHPRWLLYGSDEWSPSQAWKLLRNVYGIIGLEQGFSSVGRRKRVYKGFFIDPRNHDAVDNALANGGCFTKNVPLQTLPLLARLSERSEELQEAYGANFYPRFSTTEIGHQHGCSKEAATTALQELNGLLAHVIHPHVTDNGYKQYVSKFFLPRARRELVGELVERYA